MIAKKHEELDHLDLVKVHGPLGGALDRPADDPRTVEVGDIVERLMMRAVKAGEAAADEGIDDQFVGLLDSAMAASSPSAVRPLAMHCPAGPRGRVPGGPEPPPRYDRLRC
ncbi:hypothetical protein [Streptomyces sp. OR43]|uniref:hypothetical protein n=1 Tax=Streptomyces sp. or43 TaxID=2478957 RepID=UPI0016513EE9|nr:hypothetical protein [Streptomyces sp. or43]